MTHIMIVLMSVLALTACQRADPVSSPELEPDEIAVQDLIRASVAAENAADVEAFLALWTDDGLADYDVGTRAELSASDAPAIGEEPFQIETFVTTDVGGDTATVTVDATKLKPTFARPFFRLKYEAVREGEEWLIDGFEFLGGPPPPSDLTVLNVDAKEYAFLHALTEIEGEFAMTFTNIGKEQHELTLFKAPDGTELEAGGEVLVDVDGSELTDLPEGYEAEHLSFAEPGDSTDIVFAEPLAAGTYFMTCYIPKGGFGEEGPLDPKGKPHIELGMISRLIVT